MNLEGIAEHLVVMEMQFLTDEQKRAIANQRLGPQGLQSFNTFIQKIRGERGGEQAPGSQQGDRSEDIFGNPMMLSMLLCYLSPKADEEMGHKRSSTMEDADDARVDLMAVYRVSVSVMLKRMLLQQQADRQIHEESLIQCSRVLERAAMNMQAKHATEIDCDDFEKESAISNSNDMDHLPNYRALLTDPWWAQMLDMLAQAWPKKYVQLMERKIDEFKASDGSSYLHLAATEGHLPIFRLVKHFSDANQNCLWKARAEDQMTPLHVAAQYGHRVVCETILEKKATVDAEDHVERFLRHAARSRLSLWNSQERYPLHLALQNGHFQLARILLDRLEQVQGAGRDEHSHVKKKARLRDEVAAVLVYCAIVGIGKIGPFQKEFASEATEPIGALASIVQRHPVLVPSFQRLDEEEQNLIVECLKAEAEWSREPTADHSDVGWLVGLEELLICPQETLLHDVFSFFLFTVFMSLCAILGVKSKKLSLRCSLFMTEEMYNNFKVGLEALKTLKEKEALTVYDGFLQKRAELAGVQFDEKSSCQEQQKAIVRLICLTRIFEKEKGKRVHDEFMSLEPDIRQDSAVSG
eukprot:g21463.t1